MKVNKMTAFEVAFTHLHSVARWVCTLQAKIYVNLRGSPSNERASMIPFLGDIVSITARTLLPGPSCMSCEFGLQMNDLSKTRPDKQTLGPRTSHGHDRLGFERLRSPSISPVPCNIHIRKLKECFSLLPHNCTMRYACA